MPRAKGTTNLITESVEPIVAEPEMTQWLTATAW